MYVSFRSFIRKRRVREDETIINVATHNITCSSNSFTGGEVSQWLTSSGSFST